MRRAIAAAGVLILLTTPARFAAQRQTGLPDLDTGALASGPYSRMQMLLEKTIFGVDVLTVAVQVGEQTRRRLEELAGGPAGPEARESEIASAVIDAEQVLVTLEFQRSVSFDRWLEGVRDSLRQSLDAGLIEASTFQNVSASLPEWFRPMVERGFARGDRIVYRGYPDRMRTLVVSASGEVLVDHTGEGAEPRRTMLAGYFAPGSDFRKPLIESLRAP